MTERAADGPSGIANADSLEAALERLYARLPALECRQLCGANCGPIVMAAPEWERIAAAGGARSADDDLVCPYFERTSGRCEVHPLRPLICRLWGAVETMRCPYGCAPERLLTQEEAAQLIEELLTLAGHATRSVWPGWTRVLARAPDAPPGEPAGIPATAPPAG